MENFPDFPKEQSARGDARPQTPENEKSGRSAGRDLRRGNNGTSTDTINEHDPERYLARQDVKMKMGGFVGEVEYRGELGEFVPLLKLGEKLNVGKGTGFGLGRCQVRH